MKELEILGWLLSRKKKGKCPRCNYWIDEKTTEVIFENKPNDIKKYYLCPNCGHPLDWENF